MSSAIAERDTVIEVKCVICNKVHEVMVVFEDACEYLSPDRGRHVQHIFPYLTPEECELLISSVCPTCWNDLFPPEEELEGEEYDE